MSLIMVYNTYSVNNKNLLPHRLLEDQIRAAMKIINLNFISLVSDTNQGATCISSPNFSNKVLFQTLFYKRINKTQNDISHILSKLQT